MALPQSYSCFLNPLLGLITFLLSLTYLRASGQSISLFFIKQAITKLALRDTPAAQCTSTLRPSASFCSIQSQLSSNKWWIFSSQWSAISCFLQWMSQKSPSTFWPSNGVIRQLPHTFIALILYFFMTYSSMAASSLPRYNPHSIWSISGQSLGRSCLHFMMIPASFTRHSWQISQPGPSGLLMGLAGVSLLLHCMQNLGYGSAYWFIFLNN